MSISLRFRQHYLILAPCLCQYPSGLGNIISSQLPVYVNIPQVQVALSHLSSLFMSISLRFRQHYLILAPCLCQYPSGLGSIISSQLPVYVNIPQVQVALSHLSSLFMSISLRFRQHYLILAPCLCQYPSGLGNIISSQLPVYVNISQVYVALSHLSSLFMSISLRFKQHYLILAPCLCQYPSGLGALSHLSSLFMSISLRFRQHYLILAPCLCQYPSGLGSIISSQLPVYVNIPQVQVALSHLSSLFMSISLRFRQHYLILAPCLCQYPSGLGSIISSQLPVYVNIPQVQVALSHLSSLFMSISLRFRQHYLILAPCLCQYPSGLGSIISSQLPVYVNIPQVQVALSHLSSLFMSISLRFRQHYLILAPCLCQYPSGLGSIISSQLPVYVNIPQVQVALSHLSSLFMSISLRFRQHYLILALCLCQYPSGLGSIISSQLPVYVNIPQVQVALSHLSSLFMSISLRFRQHYLILAPCLCQYPSGLGSIISSQLPVYVNIPQVQVALSHLSSLFMSISLRFRQHYLILAPCLCQYPSGLGSIISSQLPVYVNIPQVQAALSHLSSLFMSISLRFRQHYLILAPCLCQYPSDLGSIISSQLPVYVNIPQVQVALSHLSSLFMSISLRFRQHYLILAPCLCQHPSGLGSIISSQLCVYVNIPQVQVALSHLSSLFMSISLRFMQHYLILAPCLCQYPSGLGSIISSQLPVYVNIPQVQAALSHLSSLFMSISLRFRQHYLILALCLCQYPSGLGSIISSQLPVYVNIPQIQVALSHLSSLFMSTSLRFRQHYLISALCLCQHPSGLGSIISSQLPVYVNIPQVYVALSHLSSLFMTISLRFRQHYLILALCLCQYPSGLGSIISSQLPVYVNIPQVQVALSHLSSVYVNIPQVQVALSHLSSLFM